MKVYIILEACNGDVSVLHASLSDSLIKELYDELQEMANSYHQFDLIVKELCE